MSNATTTQVTYEQLSHQQKTQLDTFQRLVEFGYLCESKDSYTVQELAKAFMQYTENQNNLASVEKLLEQFVNEKGEITQFMSSKYRNATQALFHAFTD